MTGFIAEMTNYLIPASGAPRCFKFEQNMVAEQNYPVDFRQITSEQGKAFRPYGMFIDNTRGTGRLEFLIQGLNFAGYVEPGQFFMTPYPAPMQQEVTLRGNGPAVVLFVDFPVMPYSSAQLTGGSSGGGDFAPLIAAVEARVSQTSFDAAISDILAALGGGGSGGATDLTGVISEIQGVRLNQRETIDRMVLAADLFPMLGNIQANIATIAGNSGGGGGVDPTPLLTQIEDNTYNALGKLDQIRSSVNGLQAPLGNLSSAVLSLHAAYELYDSDGNPLPSNFGSLARAYEYDVAGNIEAETRTDNLYFIWRKTYGYVADKLATQSPWVRTSI